MKRSKKNLNILGNIFIALGCLDLIDLIINHINGRFDLEQILENLSIDFAHTIAVIVITIGGVFAFLKIIGGILGMRIARGKKVEKRHLVLLRIAFIILSIVFIGSIVCYINRRIDVTCLLNSLVSALMAYMYVIDLKVLFNNKKD